MIRLHIFHPTSECVDLSVVRDHPIRLCSAPTRICVGGEPGMDHGQMGDKLGIGQIGVVTVQLVGSKLALKANSDFI